MSEEKEKTEEKKKIILNRLLINATRDLFKYLTYDGVKGGPPYKTIINKGEVPCVDDYRWGREFRLNKSIMLPTRKKKLFTAATMSVTVMAQQIKLGEEEV